MTNVPAARVYFPEADREMLKQQIAGILESGQLTLGEYTREFEKRFAGYVGTKYAIAVNSGTSALEIILRAIRISGSSVVVPSNTFFATPAAVVHAGGTVIFADSGPDLCIDPDSVRKRIRGDTRVVIAVHIGGLVSRGIFELRELCEERGLILLEDAAHAHGTELEHRKAGSLGFAGAFSFYPTKVITSGEGGMITTNDDEILRAAFILRDQGKVGFARNLHVEMGYNWRMSEIHAAVGLSQFSRLEEFINARSRIAGMYDEALGNIPRVSSLERPNGGRWNFYKYVAYLNGDIDRGALKEALRTRFGVSLSGEVYEVPCHKQPVFLKDARIEGGDFPVAEDLCGRHICLPIFVGMSDEQLHVVVSALKEVLS